jgi:hypothetical protein
VGKTLYAEGDAGCVGCANLSWRRSVVQPTAIVEARDTDCRRPYVELTCSERIGGWRIVQWCFASNSLCEAFCAVQTLLPRDSRRTHEFALLL